MRNRHNGKVDFGRTGLPVKGYCSGPLGGDQQIGAKIVEGQIVFYDLSLGSAGGAAA